MIKSVTQCEAFFFLLRINCDRRCCAIYSVSVYLLNVSAPSSVMMRRLIKPESSSFYIVLDEGVRCDGGKTQAANFKE